MGESLVVKCVWLVSIIGECDGKFIGKGGGVEIIGNVGGVSIIGKVGGGLFFGKVGGGLFFGKVGGVNGGSPWHDRPMEH